MADETKTPLITSASSDTLRSTATSMTSVSTSTDFQSNRMFLANSRGKVGVIGTGNYAIALTKRLVLVAGCDVVLGSRRPKLRRGTLTASGDCLCGTELASVADCIRRCDIVFVAIHKEDFKETLGPFAQLMKGKTVVDVSNRENRYPTLSNAEHLASILPNANVVKAFNSISAFAMENLGDSSSSHVAYLAGDDLHARAKVMAIGQAMGFRVVDLGSLTSARWMEDFVLKVFSLWKMPVLLAFAIFTFCTLHIIYIYFIEKPTPAFPWEQIFLKVANKPLCMTAITMLALTYLPGQIASILQVWRGTKHQRFPEFLDTWLKCRKQLGLVAFFLASVHAIASVLMLSPTYYSSWFHKVTVTLPANSSTLNSDLVLTPSKAWMTWKGEGACALGILAFVFLAIIAVTSIRSVGDALNWSEWRCVHSQLSYGVLVLSAAHVCVMGGPGWAKNGFPKTFKSITFLSVLLPLLVLFLRLVFSLPPLSGHLRKIRRGWERRRDPTSTAKNRRNYKFFINSCLACRGENGCEETGEVKDGNSGSIVINGGEEHSGANIGPQESGDSASFSTCNDCSNTSFGDSSNVEGAVNGIFSSSRQQSGDKVRSGQIQTGKGETKRGDSSQVVVDMELRSDANGQGCDQPYRGVRLGKGCGCDGQQAAPQTSFPACQCSSL